MKFRSLLLHRAPRVGCGVRFLLRLSLLLLLLLLPLASADEIPPLPDSARLALEEDWSSGVIDPDRWYLLRKQWGQGNHGVVPENVSIVKAEVDGKPRPVLRCEAHGDDYEGPVTGQWNRPDRVGGVIVSREHFASGRFEVRMRIGNPDEPRPGGMVPAIWTYGYRAVRVDQDRSDEFIPEQPLYHPYLQNYAKGLTFYWSEIDFPEYGKAGEYKRPMYNTFLNKQHDSRTFDVHGAADGRWHTYTTEWRTELVPIESVTDEQVVKAEGYHWIRNKAIPFDRYFGNPLKRLGENRYAVYSGAVARHWVDGRFVGENTRFVPVMSAQLNFGVWLPEWAGPAPWKVVNVDFAWVKVWQYGDPGDVFGILTEDIGNSFDENGQPLPRE